MVAFVSIRDTLNKSDHEGMVAKEDNKLLFFEELGSPSRLLYFDHPISAAVISESFCTFYGVHNSKESIILESSVFGIYPAMVESEYYNCYMDEINIASHGYTKKYEVGSIAYCVSAWDTNYQHFIIESLPRIHLCYLKTSYPIVVMDCDHIREIVTMAYPDRDFIFINKLDIIRFKSVFMPLPIAQNFEPIVPLQISSLLNLRRMVTPLPHRASGSVYLARLNVAGMAGQYRRIVNDNETIELFKRNNFDVDDFVGKTLPEKAFLASRYINVFTPIGANLINYIFTNNVININVLSHPYFNLHQYFEGLFKSLNLPISYTVVPAGVKATGDDDWVGNNNSPYKIDTKALYEYLHAIRPEKQT